MLNAGAGSWKDIGWCSPALCWDAKGDKLVFNVWSVNHGRLRATGPNNFKQKISGHAEY